MITKNLMSALFGAILISSSLSAYAFNNGHLDNVWFNTRIKTKVMKYHSIVSIEPSNGPHGLGGIPIKFDSGKNKCYSVLVWGGEISFFYTLHNFCKGVGNWVYVGAAYLDELVPIAGGGLGRIVTGGFVLPGEGKSVIVRSGTDVAGEAASYLGPLFLKPIFDKTGNIKKVKLYQAQVGTIIYSAWDPFNDPEDPGSGTYTQGAASPGLSMEQVNPNHVPKGAKACLAIVLGGSPDPGFNCPPVP